MINKHTPVQIDIDCERTGVEGARMSQTEVEVGTKTLAAVSSPLSIVRQLYGKRASSLSENRPCDFGVKAYFEELAGQLPRDSVRAGTRWI
jgi:hypothetical protein